MGILADTFCDFFPEGTQILLGDRAAIGIIASPDDIDDHVLVPGLGIAEVLFGFRQGNLGSLYGCRSPGVPKGSVTGIPEGGKLFIQNLKMSSPLLQLGQTGQEQLFTVYAGQSRLRGYYQLLLLTIITVLAIRRLLMEYLGNAYSFD